MKFTISTLCAVILSLSLFAGAPDKISYQSVIRNSSNELVINSKVSMRVSLLQGSADGESVYSELHHPVTNQNGLATIEIGGGDVQKGDFKSIDWSKGPYFIKSEFDIKGGNDFNITHTSQLLSVPYALHAVTAERLVGDPEDNGVRDRRGSSGGTTTGRYIGEYYGGGVIFYLFKDSLGVEHGLIVDITDILFDQNINNLYGSIDTNTTSLWDGFNNTGFIYSYIGGDTSTIIGKCVNSNSGGKTDWYIPSINELVLLENASFDVNKSLSRINGSRLISPANSYYSSSIPYPNIYYYTIMSMIFTSDMGYGLLIPSERCARAIRKF